MGRGRAKAKQTKVARKLKYQTLDTDLDALQRELAGSGDDDADDDPDEERQERLDVPDEREAGQDAVGEAHGSLTNSPCGIATPATWAKKA